jgi:hypothetical protein
MMTRKDTSQELDRPHYYSQFWVDVAAGKRSVADVGSDAEPFEADDELPLALPEYETAVPARPAAKPKAAKPEKKPEPARPTITSLADLANIDLLMKNSAEMDGDEVPDLEAGAMDDLAPFGEPSTEETPVVTDFEVKPEDAAEAEAEAGAEEEEDEFAGDDFDEEEEDEWGGTRRPGKAPKAPKRPPRRTF